MLESKSLKVIAAQKELLLCESGINRYVLISETRKLSPLLSKAESGIALFRRIRMFWNLGSGLHAEWRNKSRGESNMMANIKTGLAVGKSILNFWNNMKGSGD